MERRKLLGNPDFDFLLSYGGYLTVSALSELCGISLTQETSKDFINECIENLYSSFNSNVTKTKSEYTLSIDDTLITKFIKFYQTIAGRKYLYNNGDECEEITGGYVIDKLKDYAQTTYSIKLDEHIQLRTNHVSDKHTMAGIESVNKINFNTLFNEGYNTIKSDIEFVNATDSVNNYSSILLLNQVMSSDYKDPNTTWYTFDIKMHLGRHDDYVGRKIISAKLNSDLTSHYIGAYSSMMESASLESFINIYSIYLEKQYEIGDLYLKNLTELKNKYPIIPCEIKINAQKVKINTDWRNNDDIYIPDNNVENLPDGVSITYRSYIYRDGDEYTNITGGYNTFGSSNKQSSYMYIFYGGVIVNNPIDISNYSKICYEIETTSNFEDKYQASYCLQNESESYIWRYFSPPKQNERTIVKVTLLESDKTNGYKYLHQPIRGDDKMLNFKVYSIWFE